VRFIRAVEQAKEIKGVGKNVVHRLPAPWK
jgi:hypothetical protein